MLNINSLDINHIFRTKVITEKAKALSRANREYDASPESVDRFLASLSCDKWVSVMDLMRKASLGRETICKIGKQLKSNGAIDRVKKIGNSGRQEIFYQLRGE